MSAAPATASRPEPQRNSAYGKINRYTSSGSWPVSSGATPVAAKAIVTISSGLVRRHSNVGTSASAMITENARDDGSGRSSPSSSASGTATPTSAQSRQTRAGGAGGRGSAPTERRSSRTT